MKAATLSAHRPRGAGALAHLAAHLDAPPDLPVLARLAGVSPRQLERVFVRTFGESPRACLRRLRLERAAALVRTTRRRILGLALEAGFESHEAFTRAFKHRFGRTPIEYRRLPQAIPQPRHRHALWQHVLANGLRPHIETPAALPLNNGS